jgi:hypothetical protein
VTAGLGWAQREGGLIEEIRPGNVVWFAPGEKHWHGASPTTAMTHIAIQEKLNGKVVEWLEHVSDEQYRFDRRQLSRQEIVDQNAYEKPNVDRCCRRLPLKIVGKMCRETVSSSGMSRLPWKKSG